MNEYLKNFLELFSEDDQTIYQALLAKKDWLFVPLFLKGNLNQIIDSQGLKHFRLIEALYDDVLPFDKAILVNESEYSLQQRRALNEAYENFRVLSLETDRKSMDGAPFFAEYDFTKIDQRGYHALLANFFPCLRKEELEIDPLADMSLAVNQLRPLMIGPKGRYVLILESHLLIQDAFYAPILRKIHVAVSASDELKDEFRHLCKEKGIIYTEEE